jgi:hypothetical protein
MIAVAAMLALSTFRCRQRKKISTPKKAHFQGRKQRGINALVKIERPVWQWNLGAPAAGWQWNSARRSVA